MANKKYNPKQVKVLVGGVEIKPMLEEKISIEDDGVIIGIPSVYIGRTSTIVRVGTFEVMLKNTCLQLDIFKDAEGKGMPVTIKTKP